MDKRALRILAPVVVLVLCLSACGGEPPQPTAPSPTATTPTLDASPTAAEPTTAPTAEPAATAEPESPPPTVQPTAAPSADTERNDEDSQATPLLGGTTQGALSEGDQDWYVFEVPDGSIIDIAFAPGDGARDLTVVLMDPDRDVVWDEYDVDTQMRSVRWVVSGESGGSYFLQVTDGFGEYTVDLQVTSQDDAGSGGDAGGDFRTALEVETDASISGVLGDSDTADWYAFDIPAGSTLALALVPENDAQDMEIQLRDYEESRLWDAENVTARRPAQVTKVVPVEQVGVYGVGVSGRGAYTLDIAVQPQDDGGSGDDAAADIGGAVEISVGTLFAGLVGDMDRSDWYTFDVAAGSVLTVSVAPDAGTMGLEVGLHDAEDSLIDHQAIARGRSYAATVVIGPEAGGFWAIEVHSGSGGYTGQVDVALQNDAGSGGDAADDVLGAVRIAVGNSYRGIIGDTDTDDWYTFELAAGQGVVITLEGGPGAEYLSLNLRDAEDSLLDSIQSVRERDTEFLALGDDAPAGTYYLDIGSGGGGYAEYTLTIEEG